MSELDVLFTDNHLLVIDKPIGLPTMGAAPPTVHSLAGQYLKRRFNKPGEAYVGVVSRLDAMTSGVLVLARTSKAAARLQSQFAAAGDAGVCKIYLALVQGSPPGRSGELRDHVIKDESAQRMRVVTGATPGAAPARLRYVTVGRSAGGDVSLLAIRLGTGRKHQIRVQLAARGCPIVSDRKYGGRAVWPLGIGLHSWRLRIAHPTQRDDRWYTAPPPPAWQRSLAAIAAWRGQRTWQSIGSDLGIEGQLS